MKTTEYLGYEMRQDREKRWWVVSSPFEGKTFGTLREAKEAIKEVEEILEEFAEEIKRKPEGSAIMRADVEASYSVQELGGFDRLGAPSTLRKVERMVRRDVAKVARGVRVRLERFIETDSGNIGHANAYYAVALVGDIAAVSKVAERGFGYEPADLTVREAGK